MRKVKLSSYIRTASSQLNAREQRATTTPCSLVQFTNDFVWSIFERDQPGIVKAIIKQIFPDIRWRRADVPRPNDSVNYTSDRINWLYDQSTHAILDTTYSLFESVFLRS